MKMPEGVKQTGLMNSVTGYHYRIATVWNVGLLLLHFLIFQENP